jgi:hypothetical protein
MSHLGDTNKMVMDTPRTDARRGFHGWYTAVDAEFSEKLERELNAAQQRIKRLEEALEGTVKWIVDLANSGDAGFWDVDEQPEIIAARDALKKECK